MKKTTTSILAAAVILTGSAHAAVSIVGSADFTLSSTTSPGTSHDNQPASFYELVDPGSITPSGDGANLANLTDDSWATGHLSGTNSWNSNVVSTTITLSFPSANLAGLAFNWAWNDRDEGNYEVLINGTTSLGTFQVTGTQSSSESTEPNTYVVFDSPQIGVTSIQINMTDGTLGAGGRKYGLDELEVWAVPEPSSTALLGLGGLALMLRRKRS